jgi:hypothetical protein
MGKELLKRDSLRGIIAEIGSFTDEDTICAEDKPNWTAESLAYVIRIPKYTDLRSVGPIRDYFLEVFVARDVLEDWSALRHGRQPTIDEMCAALIYYALNDAQIPIEGVGGVDDDNGTTPIMK